MFKIAIRIPRQKYAYMEIEKEVQEEKLNEEVEKFLELIDKHTMTDLEVIISKKKCPKCKGKLLELIGISDKNNKPFHRIKCENKNCDYIEWISVEFSNKG